MSEQPHATDAAETTEPAGPELAKTSAAASDEVSVPRGGVSYTVQLPNFEGPLDLLLHLIQQHELDILDIPIAFITEKYVDYILLMQELNIDIASEYLVMAATLAHIKSKTLLPVSPDDQDDVDEPELDPRSELVRRLLEYQKYKLVAEQLSERSVFGRDVFSRGQPAAQVEGTAPLAPVSLFKLLDAFQGVLTRAKTVIDHEIELDRFSITDRINQLADRLRERSRLSFEELFEGQRSRADLIVTFLALLEMTRLRMTRLLQESALAPIVIELAVSDDESVEPPQQTSTQPGDAFVPSQDPQPEQSADADASAAAEGEPLVTELITNGDVELDSSDG